MREIKNLIKNQAFLVQDPEKGGSVTPCMNVYKSKIQSDEIIEKLKLISMVILDMQNNKLVGYTWSPTSSMRTLKYFLEDSVNHQTRVYQLAFIGALLQAKVQNVVL